MKSKKKKKTETKKKTEKRKQEKRKRKKKTEKEKETLKVRNRGEKRMERRPAIGRYARARMKKSLRGRGKHIKNLCVDHD